MVRCFKLLLDMMFLSVLVDNFDCSVWYFWVWKDLFLLLDVGWKEGCIFDLNFRLFSKEGCLFDLNIKLFYKIG